MPPRAERPPAPRFERDGSTLRLRDDHARVTLTVCTPRVVRVEWLAAGQVAGPSYVGERDWPGARVEVADGDPLRLATEALRVEATTRPLQLTFLDSAGAWLLREPPEGGMAAEPAGDGTARHRLQASFQFSGEQHFYGLGQGGRRSTASAWPASSGTRIWATGRARTWACRCWSPAAATRCSSTTRATACSRWDDPTTGCGSPTRRRPGPWCGTS